MNKLKGKEKMTSLEHLMFKSTLEIKSNYILKVLSGQKSLELYHRRTEQCPRTELHQNNQKQRNTTV